MLQCEECDFWRLLFSKRKLSAQDKTDIQSVIDDIIIYLWHYTAGIDLPEKFLCIYVREHNCFDPVEKLYYSAGFDPICIYCVTEDVEDCNGFYSKCSDKPSIKKRS